MVNKEITSCKRFWWECIKSAFKRKLGIISTISLFVAIVLGLVSWRSPSWEDYLNILAWALPLSVFLAIFIPTIIRCPYSLYKGKAEKVRELENKAKPQLEIEETTEQLYGGLGSVWGLIIHNQGTNEAVNCQGRLVEMEFVIPLKGQSLFRFPTNQPMKWGQEPWGISSGNISIPGLDRASLMIARWSSIRDNPRLAYACIDDPHRDTLLTGYEILLVISITSQNSVPIYAICLLDLTRRPEGYDLKLLGKQDQQPSIDDCRQLIPHTEENGNE